jgi:pilus assembly protein Flp/PilA
MRKYLEQILVLSKNEDGVVSFEYVIVAAAVVGAVTLAFGVAGGAGPISTALAGAITGITAQLP